MRDTCDEARPPATREAEADLALTGRIGDLDRRERGNPAALGPGGPCPSRPAPAAGLRAGAP